jgi:hypothetical protein
MNQAPFVINPEKWALYEQRDPGGAVYSLAYGHARQRLGMGHEAAHDFAQTEAYGAPREGGIAKESERNRRWVTAQLASPLASPLPQWSQVQAPPIPSQQEAYDQLRLALESRRNGRFASPTKVSNPEVAAAALQPRAVDLPAPSPRVSPGQRELLALLQQTQAPAADPVVAANRAQAIKEVMAEVTPSGRRLAGGYAVTGGLGLLGLLGLAALTDPYGTGPKPAAVEVEA